MQNADLSMRLKKESKTGKTGKKEKISESDLRISQISKFFGVMHEPFVPPSALLVAQPAVNSTNPDQYKSDLSKVQGITAELYKVLPKEMHFELKSSPTF